jgi:hypothetical protein
VTGLFFEEVESDSELIGVLIEFGVLLAGGVYFPCFRSNLGISSRKIKSSSGM